VSRAAHGLDGKVVGEEISERQRRNGEIVDLCVCPDRRFEIYSGVGPDGLDVIVEEDPGSANADLDVAIRIAGHGRAHEEG
jgi:hypothetical protein